MAGWVPKCNDIDYLYVKVVVFVCITVGVFLIHATAREVENVTYRENSVYDQNGG